MDTHEHTGTHMNTQKHRTDMNTVTLRNIQEHTGLHRETAGTPQEHIRT